MNEHNCVRNPDTASCYVCNTPMRASFERITGINANIEATNKPTQPTVTRIRCTLCVDTAVQGETLCVNHWIAEQTKPQPTQPTQRKHTTNKPTQPTINLDSIVQAMHNKYQN